MSGCVVSTLLHLCAVEQCIHAKIFCDVVPPGQGKCLYKFEALLVRLIGGFDA